MIGCCDVGSLGTAVLVAFETRTDGQRRAASQSVGKVLPLQNCNNCTLLHLKNALSQTWKMPSHTSKPVLGTANPAEHLPIWCAAICANCRTHTGVCRTQEGVGVQLLTQRRWHRGLSLCACVHVKHTTAKGWARKGARNSQPVTEQSTDPPSLPPKHTTRTLCRASSIACLRFNSTSLLGSTVTANRALLCVYS